jgi:hypothetical protein
MRVADAGPALGQVDLSILPLLALSCSLACGGRMDTDARGVVVSGGNPATAVLAGGSISATANGGVASLGGGTFTSSDGTAASLGGTSTATVPESANACDNESTPCGTGGGARCVVLKNDAKDCGKCGNACASGEVCRAGVCVFAACIDAQQTITTGNGPRNIITGDWNADGKTDLATANGSDKTVSVLLGCGDGRFATKVDYPIGASPSALMGCDLNGDRATDLVTTNCQPNTVTVLLGNGDGTFATKAQYDSTACAPILAAGDLSGDGALDVAIATSNTVSVLLGLGDGTLGTKADYPTVDYPIALFVRDLNGDDKADLVMGIRSYATDVSVLLGHGDGTFGERIDHKSSRMNSAFDIGDLNGDGKLDLGVGDNGGRGGPGNFSVLPGNGDGTFGTLVDYPPSVQVQMAAVGDLNGDGGMDLLGGCCGRISVLLQQAGGQLVRGSDLKIDTYTSLVLGDVNGDGKLDIATTNESANRVSLVLGNGDGTFRQ